MQLPPPGSLCWSAHSSHRGKSRTSGQRWPCSPWNQTTSLKTFWRVKRVNAFCFSLLVLSQFCALKSYSVVYHYGTLVSNIMNKTTVKCFVVVCWPADSRPGLLEAIHSVGLQGWEDCPQRGEILQLSALLHGENTRKYSLVIPLLQKKKKKECSFMSLHCSP